MSAEYSVEEVRKSATELKEIIGGGNGWTDKLRAYADLLERIKADEGAVPVACEVVGIVRENDDGKYIDWTVEGSLDALEAGDALYCIDGIEAPDDGFTELFANPPAQAAQVDVHLGAPAWPGQREGKAPPEGWVQLSVNNLATQPHSPDAADSGRVTPYMMEKLADAAAALDKLGRRNQCVHLMDLYSALAAQGQGEHIGYLVDGTDFYYPDFPQSEFAKHKSVMPIYTHPSNAASPAGVPDGWIDRAAWCAKSLMNTAGVLANVPATRDELGKGLAHLRWMAEQLAAKKLSSATKACRWLGYIQGCLITRGMTTLEAEKKRNLASIAAAPSAPEGESHE